MSGERLRTPEEVSEAMGWHVTAHEIRKMATQGRIEWVKGSRGKVLLTADQAASIVTVLTQPTTQAMAPADPRAAELGFRTSSRRRR